MPMSHVIKSDSFIGRHLSGASHDKQTKNVILSQMNVRLESNPYISAMVDLEDNVLLPLYWVEESGEMDQEHVELLKDKGENDQANQFMVDCQLLA